MNRTRRLLLSVAGVGVLSTGVALPVAASAAPAVVAHSAVVKHGVIKMHTHSKRAGSCSLYVDWTAVYGSANTGVKSSFWVKAYIDECSQGGTLKYQSKMVCTATQPGNVTYDYGPWENGTSQGSNASQGNGCWEAANGPDNGKPTLGGFKYNQLNPLPHTCFNGDFTSGRTVHGSNCGVTT
jgi:hypothetical protein